MDSPVEPMPRTLRESAISVNRRMPKVPIVGEMRPIWIKMPALPSYAVNLAKTGCVDWAQW
jgi:hypothetical protein